MAEPKQILVENEALLNNDTVIWRYVPLHELFFYLNGLVFIPSIAKLQDTDPFEGNFYEHITWFNKACSDHFGKDSSEIDEWMLNNFCCKAEQDIIGINRKQGMNVAPDYLKKRYFDFVSRTRFAWCWFQSNHEDAAMWSNYGRRGVAIKSTVGKLSKLCEETNRDFIFGKITYVDYQHGPSVEFDPLRDANLLLRPFLLKRLEYKSEQEVRFVTAANRREEGGGIILRNLNPQDWISAIRLWPELTTDQADCLRTTVQRFIPKADCQKSDLFSGPNDSSDLLQMMKSNLESAADSEWTTGQDGIPMPLKTL